MHIPSPRSLSESPGQIIWKGTPNVIPIKPNFSSYSRLLCCTWNTSYSNDIYLDLFFSMRSIIWQCRLCNLLLYKRNSQEQPIDIYFFWKVNSSSKHHLYSLKKSFIYLRKVFIKLKNHLFASKNCLSSAKIIYWLKKSVTQFRKLFIQYKNSFISSGNHFFKLKKHLINTINHLCSTKNYILLSKMIYSLY